MNKRFFTVMACLAISACSGGIDSAPRQDAGLNMEKVVNEYLLLELSMGRHDPAHVDAYFGPEEMREQAETESLSLDEIESRAAALAGQLRLIGANETGMPDPDRVEGLLMRLQALTTRIAIKRGEYLPFDEESERLFGAVAPTHDDDYFAAVLEKVDALLPGEEPLAERVKSFRARFEIPRDRIELLFETAIDECRRRTKQFIDLPENEHFRLEYVTDKPWGAYNWYQGGSQSLIQLNITPEKQIDRVVGTGCHEGYPGHHVYNMLLEQRLVKEKGWLEYSLYPLFSPESLIAEGSANYGQKLAFPKNERVEFEKTVLFPLAGLDPMEADRYYEFQELMSELNYSGNEVARNYLDGHINAEQAIQWQMDFQMKTREQAERSLSFIETYRSYVINYNLGEDLVREYVERDTTTLAERWEKFEQLLSHPVLPKDLR